MVRDVSSGQRAFAAALVIYLGLTAVIGWNVLRHPASTALHDAGDPLLNTAILHWTTTHVPLTQAWWQFPIYYPTPDVMAYSEHLLGLSVIATPLEWITRSPLVSYNLVALLTYPLSAIAMYALVWRLTRSAAGAFIAGLAYAFAPYRVPQSPHLQMLATFWAPLALLGLHGYVETRRLRWLVLFGAAWALQGASNGYYLFFFSVLVGVWVLWFVVARRDWRALWRVAVTVVIAAFALAPVLYGYLVVHARNGFVRNPEEIRLYSGDVAGVFCANELLTFWSWLRVACKTPETELFPGAALIIVCIVGTTIALRRPRSDTWGPPSGGPGVFWFYVTAAALMWLFALGPALTVVGHQTEIPGPYALLAHIPGFDELRVPARFWGLAVLSLSVVAGIAIADLLKISRRTNQRALLVLIASGIIVDGWIGAMPAGRAPASVMPPSTLANRVVMELPTGDVEDIPATYWAAIGGWTSVNGYSGYHPNYYSALNYSVRFEEDSAFLPFQARTELDVLVPTRAPRLIALVEKQSGVELVAKQNDWIHYRLPRRGRADAGRESGTRLPIRNIASACSAHALPLALDNDPVTRWVCGPTVDEQSLEIDLGNSTMVGAVVNGIGRYHDQFPPEMIVETSTDRTMWAPAWTGTLVGQTIRGGIDNPDTLRIVIPFTLRAARYVRLRHPRARNEYYWTLAELEAWSGNTSVP